MCKTYMCEEVGCLLMCQIQAGAIRKPQTCYHDIDSLYLIMCQIQASGT